MTDVIFTALFVGFCPPRCRSFRALLCNLLMTNNYFILLLLFFLLIKKRKKKYKGQKAHKHQKNIQNVWPSLKISMGTRVGKEWILWPYGD
jgi:hypothetical protein